MGEREGSYCRGMLLAGFYQKHFGFLAAAPTGSTGDIFIAKGRLDLIRYQQFFCSRGGFTTPSYLRGFASFCKFNFLNLPAEICVFMNIILSH